MKTFISTTYETSPFLVGRKINHKLNGICLAGHIFFLFEALPGIHVRSSYVTPELNNELQCNVGKNYLVCCTSMVY